MTYDPNDPVTRDERDVRGTYDARSALPRTLQTPEQGYLETGGTKLTGPTDEAMLRAIPPVGSPEWRRRMAEPITDDEETR